MSRLTRSSNAAHIDDEEEADENDIDISSSNRQRCTTMQIDKNFEYKFLVASGIELIMINCYHFCIDNESSLLHSSLIRLAHPKSSTPMLYQLSFDAQSIAELLRIDESTRSWFIDDGVVADGSLLMLAPIHPIFLILPYLIKNASVCRRFVLFHRTTGCLFSIVLRRLTTC